jgi:hypothetical protein
MDNKWDKKGQIFVPKSNERWMVSHATIPVVDPIAEDVLRIYFGVRDTSSYTTTTYIDVEAENPKNVLSVHESEPILGLGELGAFDDTGAQCSWIVNHGGMKYLYYIGWNAGVSVSYRNSIGLAISDNQGASFTRLYKGPIIDRSRTEPHFCSTPCVLIENGIWRMWYLNAIRWEMIDGRSEPLCHIKYAESRNGIDWDRREVVCIGLKSPDEGAVVRPCVIHENGLYKMWYSYRARRDYRRNPKNTYRIGYAESGDGLDWVRKDEVVGIDVSEDGWDFQMIAYPYVYKHRDTLHMVYCGNDFGKAGIGYAVYR